MKAKATSRPSTSIGFTVVFILERIPSESESDVAFASKQLALGAKNITFTSSCSGFQLSVFRVALFLDQ